MSEKIINTNLEDVLSDRMARYSKYIIQDRGLPDVRDGLKPVQRRILYAMNKEGNTSEKAYRKSAKTVGIVIGNYHPHGDSSVYEAMVRMAQDWKMKQPLVDMHGNKGSIDDDPAAAMRYTEARLSKITKELIGDIDSDTVNFSLNFDDTETEPTVFPSRYLNLLVNGSFGIAYGYATKIPTHNLAEITKACIRRLNNPNCTLEEIMEDVKGPDFPTGGVVFGKKGIIDAFTTGSGRVLVRSKVEVIEKKGTSSIVITEIPYEVVKSSLVEKIDKIRVNKDIDGISDVRDESDRSGLKIVVDLKKDVNSELILNYLYKNTSLQVYYNYNMVCIVDKKPMQLGLINIIDAYLTFYEEFTLRLTDFQIKKLESRMHILEGLIKAISILDEVIELIRASKDKGDAKNRLILTFNFTDAQAEAIVMLQLYRLTNTDILILEKELKEKASQLRDKQRIVSDKSYLKLTITNELERIIEQYSEDRKSVIIDEMVEIVIDQKALINSEVVMSSLTKGGYLKQSSMRSFKASDAYPGIREADQLIGLSEVNTLDTIIPTAKSGKYACINVYDLVESKWKDNGEHVNKYVNFAPGDSIVDGIVVNDFQTNYQVICITAKGQIKRSLLSEYNLQRRSKVSVSMKVKKDDELLRSVLCHETDELVLVTRDGFCVRYNANDIPLTGLSTQGVKALNLGKDDVVVDIAIITEKDMLTVFANSGTKRIRISEIEVSSRTKKGITICKKNKSNPAIIEGIVSGNLNDKIVIQNGQFKEIQIKDVTLMDLDSSFSGSIKLSKNYQIVRGLQFAYNSSKEGEVIDALV